MCFSIQCVVVVVDDDDDDDYSCFRCRFRYCSYNCSFISIDRIKG